MVSFIDETIIGAKAGSGGNGIVAFHQEKFVSKGGPSGGDGGRGGSVYIVGDEGKLTLIDLRYKKTYKAENGSNGQNGMKTGKSGNDIYITVPLGTQFYDESKTKLLLDIVKHGQKELLLEGGKGGKGNVHFKSSTNPRPEVSENGELRREQTFFVNLKLLADVGFVGLPSVGKSTLMSKLTAVKPKIAAYEFTTLVPQIGVAKAESNFSFVIADLPGLIKGASQGKGLGTQFLKHIARCKAICHILDITRENAFEDYKAIRNELISFSKDLGKLDEVIVANKIDVGDLAKVKELEKQIGKPIIAISALTGENEGLVLNKLGDIVKQSIVSKQDPSVSKEDKFGSLLKFKLYTFTDDEHSQIEILNYGNSVYAIKGSYVDYWMERIPFNTHQNFMRFISKLNAKSVFQKVAKLGAVDGDTILLGKNEFEFELRGDY